MTEHLNRWGFCLEEEKKSAYKTKKKERGFLRKSFVKNVCQAKILKTYLDALFFFSESGFSTVGFFLHSAFTQSFHLCILLAISKYKYVEMAARVKVKYTRNQGVNKEIAAISILFEAQALCTQKFLNKITLKKNLSNSRLKKAA